MIKKLSAIFIVLSVTSCSCYSDLFKKSSPSLVEEPELVSISEKTVEKPVAIEIPEKTVKEINKSVFFEVDSFALSSRTKEVLREEILPAIKGKKVTIEGHCDERGSAAYNEILGKKRAEAVKDYLVRNGTDSSQIKTVSYGKSKPLDLGHNKEAWARNRRVVTVFY